jgi:hypothetical protein
MKHLAGVGLLGLLLSAPAIGGDLGFGDPRSVPPPPAHAIGFPSRDPDLDVRPGFQSPPPGYGEVAFYWWLPDPLTRERLQWQIDQLAGKGVCGLQINYAHSDEGGRSWGLTYPSDPPLFSEPWWDVVQWFLKSARKAGMSISLSDYTLGIGQGWSVDEVLEENPSLRGATLEHSSRIVEGGREVGSSFPAGTLAVTAYPIGDDGVVSGPGIDLRGRVKDGGLEWTAPPGRWGLHSVRSRVEPWSLDPMNLASGPGIIEKFFQPFEDRNPGEAGRGLDFFFSDELGFGVEGHLWTDRFAEEFRRRKGYDLVPELPALFVDVGPRTPKVRLDYRDVMVALSEEGYFRPVFEWHQERGMIYGCDHGGRGRDVTEFGDYFRTQRWNQGPGADQPRLGKDVIKAKVASSIGHLYERPRVWLEGYHSSGWGTTSAQVADATFANFAMGFNLLTLHGLYYSTHGGWWEWAPPGNHFHMPYWSHMGELLHTTERLSYLLSQGRHRCDVAVMYPVAPMEADMDGAASVEAAFGLGEHLYRQGIDFDFMDFESLARAETHGRALHVSGETYRVLVLPSMRAVRHSTLRKAVELQRAGGLVVILGAPPEASDRVGRDDPEVAALVAELRTRATDSSGVVALVDSTFERDYRGPGSILHRRIGPRDVYMVYGAPKGTEVTFRATGRVELWDPWTGRTRTLPILAQTATATTLRLPLTETEPQLVVFQPGVPAMASAVAANVPTRSIPLDGPWEFELVPSLDNRWGDYHWPPTETVIGAEMRRPRHAQEIQPDPGWERPSFDDSSWPRVTTSYGPMFWKLGPLPEDVDPTALDARLAGIEQVDPSVNVEFRGRTYPWQPYEFSWRWGIEGDPGHQGYHGLKAHVSDDFIALGRVKLTSTGSSYEKEPGGSRYYLWTTAVSDRTRSARLRMGGSLPATVWLNGARVDAGEPGVLELHTGPNPLLLRFDAVGRGHVVVDAGMPDAATRRASEPGHLAMSWHHDPDILPFDVQPQVAHPAGWYRFTSPPGLRALAVPAHGEVRVWVDGKELKSEAGNRFVVARPEAEPVAVAIRVGQERGRYGGAALPDPIRLECGPGTFAPGDWSENDGLASYSGGAWYRRTVILTAEQARGQVVLDLGRVVSTAEVRVNGRQAGIKVAPPWAVDLSPHVQPGENRIEILVYNTLANHYSTIPTRYRGSPVSGLLGPVSLRMSTRSVSPD